MLVIFHSLYILVRYWLKILKKRKCLKEFVALQAVQDEDNLQSFRTVDAEENLVFDPPVYKQRYGAVQEILLDNKWKSDIKRIVDFGCSEFGLFMFIKRLCRIQEILEVDIDEQLLKENLCRIQPVTVDFLSKRTEPLVIQVLAGSVSDPDYRLIGIDVVIGIEIIEHLFPDTLDALPYNVFGFIKPKIAIFTTPNADFNQLFPNFKGFRHSDHKFEWSRQEFESWAEHIISRFPNYSVSFKGIGKGPKGTEHLGCCSQMAVFILENALEEPQMHLHMEGGTDLMNRCTCKNCLPQASIGVCTYHSCTNIFRDLVSDLPVLNVAAASGDDSRNGVRDVDDYYKVVKVIEYPYDIDHRSPEQKILDELKYRICLLGNVNGRFYNNDLNRCEIPLIELVYNQYTHFTTVCEAKQILEKADFKVEECVTFDEFETCVIYEPEMERHSSTSNSSSIDGFNTDKENSEWSTLNTEGEQSDWEVNSDIQRGSWNLSQHEVTHAEALDSASVIINHLISKAEQYASAVNQRHDTSKSSGNTRAKETSTPNDDDGGKCSHFDYGCETSNVMYDSGYYKSNTNLTTSTQSVSELLDGDIFEDQLINHTSLEEADKTDGMKNFSNIISISSSKAYKVYGDLKLNNDECKTIVIDVAERTEIMSCRTLGTNGTNEVSSDKTLSKGKSKAGLGNLAVTLDSKLNVMPSSGANKSHHLKDQSVPGTSNVKKKKKVKRFDDNDGYDNVDGLRHDRKIEFNDEQDRGNEEIVAEANGLVQLPEPVVENGDLANNNRDLEGNNYPDAEPNEQLNNGGNDNEHVVLQNNVHAAEQINEDVENRNADVEEEEVNNDGEVGGGISDDGVGASVLEVEFSSREALYDPNSSVDLLEEFNLINVDDVQSLINIEDAAQDVQDIVLFGINVNPTVSEAGPVLPANADPFPNWLLHLLGADIADDAEPHVEPHFYCQGDGVGVHPSFIEEDFEEDHASTDSDSSSSGSANDVAEAEPTVSEAEVGSLPDDTDLELTAEMELTLELILNPESGLNTESEATETATSASETPLMSVAEIAGTSSGTESAEEFFDTQEEAVSLASNTNSKSEKSQNENEVQNKN